MALGSPMTDKFPIGTAEIRIAPLNRALGHLPADSIGVLDDVTIAITNTSVNRMAGFPQKPVATAITEQTVTITGTVGEYSRRNLQILGGEAPEAPVTDAASTVATAASAGATTLELAPGDGSLFAPNQVICVYTDNRPELLTVAVIDSISTDTLTLKTSTPLLHAAVVGATKVFAAHPIGKAVTKTNFFSVQVIQSQFSDGRPLPWNFWKASITSGLDMALNPTDFSSTTMEITALEPVAKDFQTGGPLAHVADQIIEYPTYMAVLGG